MGKGGYNQCCTKGKILQCKREERCQALIKKLKLEHGIQYNKSHICHAGIECWQVTTEKSPTKVNLRMLNPYSLMLPQNLLQHHRKGVSESCLWHPQISRSNLRGSSTTSLIRRKKKTASLPSISRWSYVRAMYIIGLETISPPTTIGRFTIECMPRMADCQ